jgi:hypothetical protein
MMKSLLLSMLAVSLLCACESTPPTADAPPPETVAPVAQVQTVSKTPTSEADLDKVTCTQEGETGTRFPHKVCMTERQRRQLAQDARDAMTSHGCSGGSCGGN